jgi:hypothetical protein
MKFSLILFSRAQPQGYRITVETAGLYVLEALLAVQQGYMFKFKLLNSAYNTLLPKKADALEVKDYRPISLIHSFAKLLAKLLANILPPKLLELVPINQSTFKRDGVL